MKETIANAINHLQHVGIPVSDIAVSKSFYESLGFKSVMEAPFSMEGETGICVMMKLKTILIELYQLPSTKIAEIKQRKDGHIDHIAFDVDNIDEAFTLLKEASFYILEEEPVRLSFWDKGCRYFNILGPDGERLEFNQILR
ncbi:MAG: VOC family protein [Chitinophagaceae bacterium]